MKLFNNIKGRLQLLWHSLFRGMSAADNIIKAPVGSDHSVEVVQQINNGGVFDDMLQQKETQRVIETRDKYYRVLKEADLILAEDTRTSSVLLKHYEIHGRLESHHKFNEHKTSAMIKERILAGLNVALISDAGTPGISDPGFLLVRTCVQEGIEVQTLPGATAFVPALVSSGYPCDRFCFEGFLPQKKGRQTRLTELAQEQRTMIFYESPYRLVKTLEQFAEFFGAERECSVAREISKKFEEHKRGGLLEVAQWYKEHEPKGEIVIIVAGAPEKKKEKKRYNEDE